MDRSHLSNAKELWAAALSGTTTINVSPLAGGVYSLAPSYALLTAGSGPPATPTG